MTYKPPKIDTTIKVKQKNCPRCGARLVIRRNSWNNLFVGCGNFPSCKFTDDYEEDKYGYGLIGFGKISQKLPVDTWRCENCGGEVVIREDKLTHMDRMVCMNHPKCKFVGETPMQQRQKYLDAMLRHHNQDTKRKNNNYCGIGDPQDEVEFCSEMPFDLF